MPPKSKRSAKGSGSAGPPAKKKKTPRTPAPYISLPGETGGRKRQVPDAKQNEEDSQEEMAAALEAEQMAALDSDSDDSDEDKDVEPRKRLPSSKGKEKALESSANFLLNLDKKGISRSRTEEARLKKAERAADRHEGRVGSSSRTKERAVAASDSDAESTDMEGASEGSQSSNDFESLSDEEDFDSEDVLSDESPEEGDSDFDEDKEDRAERLHAERLSARRKRQRAEDLAVEVTSKNKRLPVRGEAGTWLEGDEGDEDSEGDEDAEDLPDEQVGKGKGKSSRATHPVQLADTPSSDEESEADEEEERHQEPVSTITTGARFGMQAPYAIMSLRPASARVAAARDQIARLATDIVGDPEVSVGLLRRLSVFALTTISMPEHDAMSRSRGLPAKLPVDDAIRGAALLSLTAVYIDILPGYRIRALSEKEKDEKVNQETARRREYEQGLVDIYREHLKNCEKVLRAKTPLSSIALRSMCLLLTRATHFNFRTNLIGSVVSHLSRRSWNPDSQQCAEALTDILRRDLGGDVSLEVVRLLNRMIKETHFRVNARVLNILLHLRLKDELGRRRAGTTRADKHDDDEASAQNAKKRFQSGKGKAKPSDVRKGKGEHLSKKQVKKARELKQVEAEMREAEAEIDKDERDRNHTETLKLLFVLYFSILKAPTAPGPLLGAALEGLSRFAHRVNVDFFRDLIAVLRAHIENARAGGILADAQAKLNGIGAGSDEEDEEEDDEPEQDDLRKALLCLVTSFELLSGQGEALNIDLSDLVAHLYSLMLPLCCSPSLEDTPALAAAASSSTSSGDKSKFQSETHLLRTDADLLLRALDLTLLRPRVSSLPSERTASFVKRMLLCALYVPSTTALRLLGVVRSLLGKDPKLEALLDTEDRAMNGVYDPSAEDVGALDISRPLSAGEVAWELMALREHVNEDVAAEAQKILMTQR